MDYKNFDAMQIYGGGFLKALCSAFCLADHDNCEKLSKAFPEVGRAHRAFSWDDTLHPVVKDPFANEENK